MMHRITATILACMLTMPAGADTPFAVVKRTKGTVIAKTMESGLEIATGTGTLLPSATLVETAEDSHIELRLFTGEGTLILHGHSLVHLGRKRYENQVHTTAILKKGTAEIKQLPPDSSLRLESFNSLAMPKAAHLILQLGENATILLVRDGEVKVHNRPRDITGVVTKGQKCISDDQGLKILDMDFGDLGEFKQSYLEVDFIDPITEESRTLEIDYDTEF